MPTDTLIERPGDLTPEWLTSVLGTGAVAAFDYQRIGTGQMGECYRVQLTYAGAAQGPASVVLKAAASDPTGRQTGLALGLYEREVKFYADIASRLTGPVSRCHHAAFDPDTGIFDLVLDDAADPQVGDEIRDATIEQAMLATAELGRIHGLLLGDSQLAESEWLNREAPVNQALIAALYAGFAERYAESMTAEQRDVCEQLMERFDGGWIRLGLYPNENHAWINALLCGPDMPTIALDDFHTALPADMTGVRTDDITLTQTVIAPLQRYRVTVTGRGQSYDDPAALLRGEAGRPVSVSMDLEWHTAGTPYQYWITPRYEIPCTVIGTVVVEGHSYAFDSVPGQRDHSWGVRDWWSMDWVWSALHLDDGTDLHGVDLRIDGMPPIGIGYVLPSGGALLESQTVRAAEVFADDDLPVSAELKLGPGGITADLQVVAHAPVRLVAGDGRISDFPRAWVDVSTADGRHGVGWVEWNRNRG